MTTPENTLEAPEHPSEALSVDPAAHMMEFRAPDLDGSGGGEDDVIALGDDGQPVDQIDTAEAVELMSKDAFYVVIRHSFGLPGMFMPDWRPLAIQPEEETIARDASDAIYELLEIYYPGALMPQGDTFARLATAAPFILAKVMVVREILNAKRRARMATPQASPGQGQGQGPTFTTSREKPAPASAKIDGPPADPVSWMDAQEEVAA